MSTRYEGAGAKDTRITVHAAGEEIGDEVVPEGQIALAFNYDEVFYLQGTPGEIMIALAEASVALQKWLQDRPGFSAGDRVIWTDPDGSQRKAGVIESIRDDELDEAYVAFDDGGYAEVYFQELEKENHE